MCFTLVKMYLFKVVGLKLNILFVKIPNEVGVARGVF